MTLLVPWKHASCSDAEISVELVLVGLQFRIGDYEAGILLVGSTQKLGAPSIEAVKSIAIGLPLEMNRVRT
jgi:hypothetical protein